MYQKLLTGIGLFLVFSLMFSIPMVHAQQPNPVIPNEFLVAVSDDISIQSIEDEYDVQVIYKYKHALNGLAIKANPDVIDQLRNDPRIESIQENQVVQVDAQVIPTGVDRMDGELNPVAKIDGIDERVDVDIAVLDTGVDTNHRDLNVVNCVRFIGSSCEDGHGHGSHVSGTAGAIDDSNGVVGVSAGARIHGVKVLSDSGSGSFASVAAGVDWVAQNSDIIEVANMSLGGSGRDDGNCGHTNGDILHQAICRAVDKGVVFVVSAGNNNGNAAFKIPAAYDEVITVSAVADYDGEFGGKSNPTCANFGADDRMASFSNYGADVDIAAAGVCILSTHKNGGYATLSGTSMSAPHVTGAVANYLAVHDKPTDKAGTILVKEAIQALSIEWDDPRGYTGDKDSLHEKFLWLESSGAEPPADTEPPVIEFINPKDGDSLTGKTTIEVSATDASGVDSVTIDVNGKKFKGSDSTEPYTWSFVTKSKKDGDHIITASACDLVGNCDSKSITVSILNPKGNQ